MLRPLAAVCALILALLVAGPLARAADAPEFHARSGLPHVAAKIARGEDVRVAFLGGSITAAHGWRVHTLTRLRTLYPRSKFTEIFAAVSGTGSNYGAMRLPRDVLRHAPDLLLVEFAVNDGGVPSALIEAQMEGIVRRTWSQLPATDVCFVYTVSESMLPDLLAGRYQTTARAMEAVAEHYRIPSFNFGVEVARRARAGTLVFSAPASVTADAQGLDPRGRLIFTRDKTHPTPAGHRLYAERLGAALPALLAVGPPGPRVPGEPRRADHRGRGRIVSAAEVTRDDLWSPVPPGDPHMLAQGGEDLVPPLWVAFEPGATLEFRFRGNALGLIGLKGPENGEFRVTVDDLPPETGTLFDSFSRPGRFVLKPWFFSRPLAEGEHRVRLEILPTRIDKAAIMAKAGTPIDDPKPYAAHGLYLGGFLINGDPVGTRPPPPERGPFTAHDLPVVPTPPPGYTLAWQDEFDGPTLDTSRWLHRLDTRYWSTQQPENVAVRDGLLWLAGRREKVGASDYTGGGVITRRVFRHGYYEARFKVPATKGWHTSFWMMHHARADPAAHVGSRQEIDVCENDSVRVTRYDANLHVWSPTHRGIGHRIIRTPDLAADFHVWGCEFTPEKITYYFDGRVVLENDARLIPDHGDMSIWLTMIAAPLGPTDAVDDSALPVYAAFDYVRFYAPDAPAPGRP